MASLKTDLFLTGLCCHCRYRCRQHCSCRCRHRHQSRRRRRNKISDIVNRVSNFNFFFLLFYIFFYLFLAAVVEKIKQNKTKKEIQQILVFIIGYTPTNNASVL